MNQRVVTRSRVLLWVVILIAALAWAVDGRPAHSVADTAPPSGTPASVSADGLRTWQINGVVWAQAVLGDTLYATGKFTSARPPGSPVGTNEVARGNLLAYNLRTGALITTFNHSLNAQGLAVAVSPDGARVYVAGDFTAVDGQPRGHMAAFDVATGALTASFHPSVGGKGRALVATASAVYVGGEFTAVGAVTRRFAAAVNPITGALTAWNPNAGGAVWTMTLSPDRSRMVLGGRFTTLGGQYRYGLGAVDLSAGAVTQWNTGLIVRDAGPNAAITSLVADSSRIYGTGYVFGGGGNVEGRFAIDAVGNLIWLDDCHGDSYSAVPIGNVLYSVGHAHYCGNMGSFPETNPRSYHRALAETVYPTGKLTANMSGSYPSFPAQPCGTQLDWYPDVALGTFTGQYQGAWSVVGNGSYLALGGEFPRVNGVAQQGLVRFAVSPLAPNKVGPVASSNLTPRATKVGSSVRLDFGATWDPDNAVLTYSVYRSRTAAGVASTSADTRFYRLGSTRSVTDASPPSGTFTYHVVARDAFGNAVTSGNSAPVTISGGNVAPTASFTTTCTNLACSLDAGASRDSDGSISSYAWTFGDGTNGSGATVSHTYARSGTYSIVLTVTDNRCATGQPARSVSFGTPAPAGVFASDAFSRAMSGGWGTADVGGTWTATNSAADLSVTPGSGRLNLPAAGTGTGALLGSTASAPSAVLTTSFSAPAVANGNGVVVTLTGRRVDATHEYRAQRAPVAVGRRRRLRHQAGRFEHRGPGWFGEECVGHQLFGRFDPAVEVDAVHERWSHDSRPQGLDRGERTGRRAAVGLGQLRRSAVGWFDRHPRLPERVVDVGPGRGVRQLAVRVPLITSGRRATRSAGPLR